MLSFVKSIVVGPLLDGTFEAQKARSLEAPEAGSPEGGLVLSPEAFTIKHYMAEIISKSQKSRVCVTFSHPRLTIS